MQYNELMTEGICVLARLVPVVTSGNVNIGPFAASTFDRIVFDIMIGSVATSIVPTLQSGPAVSGGPPLTITTPVALNGATAGQLPVLATIATVSSLYRFEFSQEALGAAMAATAGSGKFLNMLLTLTGSSSVVAGVAYGVAMSYPAADVLINPFNPAITTATPIPTSANMALYGVSVLNTYVNGVVGAPPATASATTILTLPA